MSDPIRTPITEDPLVRDLLNPDNLPGAPSHVEFRHTHGSLVFLTDTDVYKLKRAKDYGFLDYSTPERRHHFCNEEVRLNRRTAADVYLGVIPVYRDAAGFSLTRKGGALVDHAVHMTRLADDDSALAWLDRGSLHPNQVETIAESIASFHAAAEPAAANPAALREAIEQNFEQVAPFVGRLLDSTLFDTIKHQHREWLADHAALLSKRPCCDGHGDLRLEHVYLIDGRPTVIDCIEFNSAFRIADPALDAAFFSMDLEERSRSDLAESFLARYIETTHDFDAYPLLDGYMSYRAMVRAKVAGFVATAGDTEPGHAARKVDKARRLFALARDLLLPHRPQPTLIVVAGIIASGKSTLADALARRMCVPHIGADPTRKFLAGVPLLEQGPAEIYSAQFTARVQDELARAAGLVLQSGRSVILDSTMSKRHFRDQLRHTASHHGADFLLVECQVPTETARERLQRRSHSVSDARADLLESFLAGFERIDEIPKAQHVEVDGMAPTAGVVAGLLRTHLASVAGQG